MSKSPPRMRSALRRAWRFLRELLASCHQHRLGIESAALAFYFFLSFFPLILVLFAITGLLGRGLAFDWIMEELLVALPPSAARTTGQFVGQVTDSRSSGALSIGLVMTLWIASNVFAALAEGLNQAYGAKHRHRWWKKRALALALLLVLALALVTCAFVVLTGPEIARALKIRELESGLRWPITVLLAISMMWLTYYWLPNHDQSRAKPWILVGALVGTTLWIAATISFRIFLSYSGRLSAVYGLVWGMVALLIWLYLTAMSILVGGEVAAALERRRALSSR